MRLVSVTRNSEVGADGATRSTSLCEGLREQTPAPRRVLSSPAVPQDLSDAVSLQSQRATRHLKKESAISTQLLVAGRALGGA